MKNNNTHQINICEICGSRDLIHTYNGKDRLLGINGEFEILQCKHCDLYLVSPKLPEEEMSNYYPQEYLCYRKAIEDSENIFQRINQSLARNKLCRQVEKRTKQKGILLDVGCATGIFLDGMRQRGWQVRGVEPNQDAAQYAQDRFGLDVFPGYLHEVKLESDTFDVVTIWDVLEHVPDPHAFVNDIYRVLKPGGLIIANLPNGEAWERYLFGKYWVGWEIPRHYRTFTPTSIKNFLTGQGFTNIDVFSFIGRHGVFILSVKFWLDGIKIAPWIKKIVYLLLRSFLFRILSLPVFLFAEKLNRGNNMSFSAQKPFTSKNNA